MKRLVMLLICVSTMFVLMGCSTIPEDERSVMHSCGFSRCPGHLLPGDRCDVGFYIWPWPPGWFADWERWDGGIVLFKDGLLLEIE